MRHEFCRIWTHTASAAIFIRLRPCRRGIEGFVTVPAQSTLLLFSILTPARKVNTSHSEAFQSEPGQAKARRTFGVIACKTVEIYQIRFNFIFLSGFWQKRQVNEFSFSTVLMIVRASLHNYDNILATWVIDSVLPKRPIICSSGHALPARVGGWWQPLPTMTLYFLGLWWSNLLARSVCSLS